MNDPYAWAGWFLVAGFVVLALVVFALAALVGIAAAEALR